MAWQTVTEEGHAAAGRGARERLRAAWCRPAVRHLAILAGYLVAGIAVTWPRAAYLVQGRLPSYLDVTSYVWDLWWSLTRSRTWATRT